MGLRLTDFSPSHFFQMKRSVSYAVSKVSSNSKRQQGSKNRVGSHGLKIRGWTSLHGRTVEKPAKSNRGLWPPYLHAQV